jgi:hypothetical protein
MVAGPPRTSDFAAVSKPPRISGPPRVLRRTLEERLPFAHSMPLHHCAAIDHGDLIESPAPTKLALGIGRS